MKVEIAQIEQDRSPGKRSSHIPLLALANELKEDISSLYTKCEVQHLCNAYKVRFLQSWNKANLAKTLVQAIPVYDDIPLHQITSTYTVETVGVEQHLPVQQIYLFYEYVAYNVVKQTQLQQ